MNFDDSPRRQSPRQSLRRFRKVEYQHVETDGARHAAQRIAEML
jgi:hypothetical protein